MAEIKAVYKSSDPRHVVALNETEAKRVATQPLREAFAAEYPGSQPYMNSDGAITCVYFPNPPDMTAWKQKTGRDRFGKYEPRAKGGEAVAAQLAAMSSPHRTSFVGMPDFSGLFSRPGYRLVSDTVWMVWSVDPETIEKSESFDGEIWERVKLSDYYLMLESQPKEPTNDDNA